METNRKTEAIEAWLTPASLTEFASTDIPAEWLEYEEPRPGELLFRYPVASFRYLALDAHIPTIAFSGLDHVTLARCKISRELARERRLMR